MISLHFLAPRPCAECTRHWSTTCSRGGRPCITAVSPWTAASLSRLGAIQKNSLPSQVQGEARAQGSGLKVCLGFRNSLQASLSGLLPSRGKREAHTKRRHREYDMQQHALQFELRTILSTLTELLRVLLLLQQQPRLVGAARNGNQMTMVWL